MLPPINHHIFRIFHPSPKECNRIDVEIRRALWTRRFGDVEQRRHTIVKERLGVDYDRGGLKLHNTNFRAFKIVLKSQAATLRYCSSFPDSVLGQLEDWSSVCQLKGSGDLSATKSLFLGLSSLLVRMCFSGDGSRNFLLLWRLSPSGSPILPCKEAFMLLWVPPTASVTSSSTPTVTPLTASNHSSATSLASQQR